ncbi:femAB family protein [bacterium BMS3Abin04]|nr:femAB family protein [bacterium BMS3Abin04]
MITNYKIETFKRPSDEWVKLLNKFDDANIYQTTEFAENSNYGKNIEHFVISKDNKILGIALVRIFILPILKRGTAYIRWGPLWKLKDSAINLDNLTLVLTALWNEYVTKRKLHLNIFPNIFKEKDNNLIPVLTGIGFNLKEYDNPYQTIYLDLSPSLKELKKNFRKKWRYELNKSCKNELTITRGKDAKYFDEFLKLYKEMHQTKQFVEHINVESFKKMQQSLPDSLKMDVFLAYHEDEPIAALVGTNIGEIGIYLLGASARKGRELGASYQLQWYMLSWLKESGCKYYDLGGIDPEGAPGVTRFKAGLGGTILTSYGEFGAVTNTMSKGLVLLGEKLKSK